MVRCASRAASPPSHCSVMGSLTALQRCIPHTAAAAPSPRSSRCGAADAAIHCSLSAGIAAGCEVSVDTPAMWPPQGPCCCPTRYGACPALCRLLGSGLPPCRALTSTAQQALGALTPSRLRSWECLGSIACIARSPSHSCCPPVQSLRCTPVWQGRQRAQDRFQASSSCHPALHHRPGRSCGPDGGESDAST